MFKLLHDGETLGTTLFESSDPALHQVSGVFDNLGGAITLSAWILSNGGTEDGEVIYMDLNKDFGVTTADGEPVVFDEGTLIAVPNEGEAYLELIVGNARVYAKHFAEHLEAVAEEE